MIAQYDSNPYTYPKMGLPHPETKCSAEELSRGDAKMGNPNEWATREWIDYCENRHGRSRTEMHRARRNIWKRKFRQRGIGI